MTQSKYRSDQERAKAYKAQQNSYAKKDWKCDVCDIVIRVGNKTNHLQSKRHLKKLSPADECSGKTWKCDACDIEINLRSKANHLNSERHLRNERKGNNECLSSIDSDTSCKSGIE
jgi:ribosomal protein L37AE/L43A